MTSSANGFRDQVNGMIAAAVGPSAKIVWEGKAVKDADKPVASDSWIRVIVQHVTGRQASLAGADGRRRWRRAGFVHVQAFAPLRTSSVKGATALACMVRDALQGNTTAGCAWFRNARIAEVGESQDWFQVNAIVDFEYDEITSSAPLPPEPAPIPEPQPTYTFTTPAFQWVINHNAGRRVSVDAYTMGGQLIWASVQNVSLNQVVITFDSPQDGYAIVDYH